MRTVVKTSCEMKSVVSEPSPHTSGVNECDTDADTCCLGKNFIVYKYTRRTADVYAFDKSYAPSTNVPIVTGATAYDDPISGRTFILLFNEALYYGSRMDHSLFNPNQFRMYGIPVWDNPFGHERPFSIQVSDEVSIPLMSKGTKIYFSSRVPTDKELQSCPKIHMTSDHPWNPSEVTLQELKRKPTNDLPPMKKILINCNDRFQYREDMSSDDIMLNEISSSLTNMHSKALYDPNTEDIQPNKTYVSFERHNQVSSDNIAEMLCIGPDKAK